MTDELCAREGCGAPKAWHTKKSTLEELHYGHEAIWPDVEEGYCVGRKCTCRGFLAPEPPKPERKAWVVELDAAYEGAMGGTGGFVPLDEYLAAHPQPAPALCICGGTADEHDPVTGRCQHKTQRMLYADSGSVIERLRCGCQKFAAQP